MQGSRCERDDSFASQGLNFAGSPDVFVGAVAQAVIIAFTPRVDGAFFGQGHRELTATLDFDDPVVVEGLDATRSFASI